MMDEITITHETSYPEGWLYRESGEDDWQAIGDDTEDSSDAAARRIAADEFPGHRVIWMRYGGDYGLVIQEGRA